jgi:hypothetical protein
MICLFPDGAVAVVSADTVRRIESVLLVSPEVTAADERLLPDPREPAVIDSAAELVNCLAIS